MTTQTMASTVAERKKKKENRQARVAVMGLGYVGLPLSLLYSEQKFRVTGFDIDERKITLLAKGSTYIHRILAEEIQQAQANGFTATSDYSKLRDMDAIIICVP